MKIDRSTPPESAEKPKAPAEQPEQTPDIPPEAPVEPSETPEEPAEAPEAPVEPSETPEEPEEAPEAPVEPSETPEEPAETPEAPVEPSETPEEPAEAPEAPVEPSETPEEPAEAPEAPVEPSETSEEPAETPEAPVEPSEPPAETAEASPPQPRRGKGLRILGIVLAVLLALALIGYLAVRAVTEAGRRSLLQGMTPSDDAVQAVQNAESDAGLVSYNGKKYRYNEDLINILFMGIDNKNTPFVAKEQWGTSGQADSNMLILYDSAKNSAKMLALSRDSMVDIKCYDHEQNFMGWGESHLCLGFAMGDGAHVSCQLMVDAVSHLLYGVPIQNYCAVSIQKIPEINDLLGGVTVTVPNDDLNVAPYYYAKGDTVTLWGQNASAFVQARDTSVDGSNNGRMERQKAYLSALVKTAPAQIAANPSMVLSVLDTMNGYYLTDLDAGEILYLAQNVGGLQLSMSEGFYTLPGQNNFENAYDEYIIDDEALFELVLELFYNEVTE